MATAQTYNPTTATSQGYTAQGYDPSTATASNWNVDQNQLVQNQVQGIIAKDSPLMQQAATTAKQGMAQRGLLNSSMAVGAGQNAVIASAMPMAQQDAGTYAQSAQFNAQNNTNVNLANAGFRNDAARFNAGERNQAAQFGADAANRVGMFNADARNQAGQFNANQQNQFGLTQLQGQIDINKMTQQQRNTLEQMATAQGYDLQKMDAQQLQTLAQMAVQQQYAMTQLGSQQAFQESMARLQESGMDFRQAREIASREMLSQLEMAGVQNRFDQELALRAEQFNVEQYNLERRQILDNQAQMERLGLQINANNQNIPTSFAANISNTTMMGVNAILGDGNLSAAAKTTAINNLVNYANQQISWAEKFYATAIPRISSPTIA